ncbi:hypothetical protein GGQ73_004717 [Rhizobium skierniewicense]|uniref:Uncharacterized protein n=1 Tax=Rhizobium skierniewicense TaxID=984260 RepID=A0A7W6CF10_9HYPH|nr:hypothetical protein [Rhizobium skierniewicense]MBB3948722.1 hypothetical protein [Rhizobium skierniewicense]
MISTKRFRIRLKPSYICLAVSIFLLPEISKANSKLFCDFEGYDKSARFHEIMKIARDSYDVRFGLGHFGTPEIHERLREQVNLLDVDPGRTSLVNADFDNGKIDLFYCASKKCTRSEIESESLRACMNNLGAKSCRTYAINVNNDAICIVLPRAQNG